MREAYVTDLVGCRFTAVYFTEHGAIPANALDGKLSGGPSPFKLIPVTRHLPSKTCGLAGWDHTGRLFALYGAQPGSLYLVRPDGHVLGRWRVVAPDEILTAIEHVLGRPSQTESKK